MFKKGDKVRCVKPLTNKIAKGTVTTVLADSDTVTGTVKVECPNMTTGWVKWYNERFELVEEAPKADAIIQAPIPLTKENAKVGLKVVCANGSVKSKSLIKGQIYEITSILQDYEHVMLQGVKTPWYINRFVIAQEAVAAPKQLLCIEGYRPAHLVAGRLYTVAKETDKLIGVVEIPGKLFAKRRFANDVVPIPAAPVAPQEIAPRKIAVGDTVYVVAKVEETDDGRSCRWSSRGHMDQFLNSPEPGVVRDVSRSGIEVWIDNTTWYFLKECLSHTPHGQPAPVAAPVAAKPVEKQAPTILTELRKRKHSHHDSKITAFAYTNADGLTKYETNPACFAPIRYAGVFTEFAIDTQCHKKLLGADPILKEANILYLNYLFNDSPWASCFLTKDAGKAMEEGILMDCNKTPGQLVGAGTAVREAIEQIRLPMFKEILDAGYHGNVAYVMGMMFSRKGDKLTTLGPNSGHTCMSTALSTDVMAKFFREGFPDVGVGPANKVASHYAVYNSYGGGIEYCGSAGPGPSLAYFRDQNIKATVIGTGFNKKSVIRDKAFHQFASLLETILVK